MTETDVDPTFYLKMVKNEEQTAEYLDYREKWNENPKNFIVDDFPIHIDLETNTNCNLKCFMCFQSYDPPKPSKMETELFKKIIDEGAKAGLCSIKTQYRGEPLLDKRMPQMVKYAKDKGILEVMFNTNATLLSEETAKALIEAGLDKIMCSVDGYTKDVYESVRIGANFGTVLNNIKNLQSLKKSMGSKRPIVRVQMVDTPRNHHQIEEYIKFWGEIANNTCLHCPNKPTANKDDQYRPDQACPCILPIPFRKRRDRLYCRHPSRQHPSSARNLRAVLSGIPPHLTLLNYRLSPPKNSRSIFYKHR